MQEKKKKKNLATRPRQDGSFEALDRHLLDQLAPKKVSFLHQPLVSQVHWPVVQWAEQAWTLSIWLSQPGALLLVASRS